MTLYELFTKAQLQMILDEMKIPYDKSDTKRELVEIIKRSVTIQQDTQIVQYRELDKVIDTYTLRLKDLTEQLCKARVPKTSFPHTQITF